MKKKFKLLPILLLVCILITGCFNNMTPSEKTESMLDRYIKNDKSILDELDETLNTHDLSKDQKERYKKIIKDEYSSIKYKIKDEKIDGNEATVEVEITVKDLYKASKEAGEYLIDHASEFYTNDIYDESKFVDYKLSKMENTKGTITYTLTIILTNSDGMWTITDLDNDTLEKIHGIYDYEKNNA